MSITGSSDLWLTLGIILDQVHAQLHVDAACVLRSEPHSQVLEFVAAKGFRSDRIRRTRLRPGESWAGQAALERRLIVIPDLSRPPEPFVRLAHLEGEGFVTGCAVPLLAKGYVKGVLEIFQRTPFQPNPEWVDYLQTLAAQTAIAVDNSILFEGLQRSNAELTAAYDATIEGWSRALELRDHRTEGHSQRVTATTMALARAVGLTPADLVQVRRGALLHDIGKMGVPDHILLKPGPLTEEESVIMRRHPAYAYEMLSPIAFLRPALGIPYCHHEKWDGTGYPRGLAGEHIPLGARLFAVADIFDAMTHDRAYRKALDPKLVRAHIRSLAGSHLDPAAVEAFLKMEFS